MEERLPGSKEWWSISGLTLRAVVRLPNRTNLCSLAWSATESHKCILYYTPFKPYNNFQFEFFQSHIWSFRILVLDFSTVRLLTFLLCKNWSAVFALLRKCGLFRFRPLSTGCEQTNAFRTSIFYRSRVTRQPLLKLTSFSPDKTSSNASRRVPSLRSSIKSSTRSGGLLWKRFRSSILSFLATRHSQRNLYTTIENSYTTISKKKIKIYACQTSLAVREKTKSLRLFTRNFVVTINSKEINVNGIFQIHVTFLIKLDFLSWRTNLPYSFCACISG